MQSDSTPLAQRLEIEIWVAQFACLLNKEHPAIATEFARQLALAVHKHMQYLPPELSVATFLDLLKAENNSTRGPDRSLEDDLRGPPGVE